MKSPHFKILQVFASLDMGGAESRMMDVYRKINKEEFQFDFLSMSLHEQYYEKEIISLGGHIHKIHSPRESGIFKNIAEMKRIMQEGKYDAIHAHTLHHCALATYAAKKANIPIRIAHARNSDSQHKSFFNQISQIIGKLLMPFTTTSQLAISVEAGKYLFGKNHFEILPNAIDLDKYQNTSNDICESLRTEFNINKDSLIIGMVGRFNMMKNHVFALNWFSQFLKIHPKAILVLIGDATFDKINVKAMAKDLNISNSIRFTGVRSDVHHWMHVFNLLIMPSLFEGLAGVILEAQAAGCPVVKSDCFTNEADMGVGLVQEISLQAPYTDWNSAVEKAQQQEKPSIQIINDAFAKKGYSLDHEIKILRKVYSGN